MILSDFIIDEIATCGPIPFRDFMDKALYYPELGYYMASEEIIGTAGDYYTSPAVSPVFGAVIGRQLEEMWHLLGEEPFTIVEYGAGTGCLCHAILDYLKHNDALYTHLRYCIIEKSPVMRQKEQQCLTEKVSWHNAIEDIGEITGCILSNELLDNFSVHKVVMCHQLMEVYVNYKNNFEEELHPASEEINAYLDALHISLPKGFRAEINLDAIPWIETIARHLKKGYMLTIDYGYPSFELYQNYRKYGTLVCYYKHKVSDNPYRHIGSQDITAHVNFSALYHWGAKNNLDCCGYTDQAHFLTALGFKECLRQIAVPGQDYFNFKKEQYLTQTLLMDMGTKLKVFIQQKNAPLQQLTGLSDC